MTRALRCVECEELLALATLGALTRREGAPLGAHLTGCDACRLAARLYGEGTIRLSGVLESAEPPASIRRRLMVVAYADLARAPRARAWRRARRSMSRRRALSLAGAAATATALAAALAAVSHSGNGSTRAYTVIGTTTAPSASGTIVYSSEQYQAIMTVTGLPQRISVVGAPQPVYEVWLVRANGSAEGVGFLEQTPATRTWSTVIDADISRFVAVAATVEPAGGSPEPTGPQLLSVQVTR